MFYFIHYINNLDDSKIPAYTICPNNEIISSAVTTLILHMKYIIPKIYVSREYFAAKNDEPRF